VTQSAVASHGAWLATRVPPAPAELLARVRALLDAHPEWSELPRAEALIAASEALLARVLAGEDKSRATALDLLAADACVTYAFEAAADDPASIGALAERAMHRVARLSEN